MNELEVEEKKKKYKDFIKSDRFTLAAYSALSLFSINIRKMSNLIKREVELTSKLYDNENGTGSKDNLTEAGFVQIDILCKIMMMIEGVCALIVGLNVGIKDVPKTLSYYSSGVVKQLQEELDKKSVEEKKVFMWKVLCLPDVNQLVYLSSDERKFVSEALSETCEINYGRLAGSINFYLSHQIAYNKFKHGFSFFSYLPSSNMTSQDALSVALHRGKKPKHKANLFPLKGTFLPKEYNWYNIISIMHVGKHTLGGFVNYSNSIDDFSQFIIQNNLLYSENCGFDYLPLKLLEGNKEIEPWLYLKPLTQERIEKVKDIYKKVFPHIHLSLQRIGTFDFHFGGKTYSELEHLIKKFGAAIVWASEENIEFPQIVHKVEMK